VSLSGYSLSGLRWNVATLIVTLVSAYAQTIIVAREVSVGEIGRIAIVLIVVGFVQSLADLGLSAAIVQRTSIRSGELDSLFWLQLGVGTVGSFVLFPVANVVAYLADDPATKDLLRLVFVTPPIAAVAGIYRAIHLRHLRWGVLATAEMADGVVRAVVASTLAIADRGAWSLAWAHVAGMIVQATVLASCGSPRFVPSLRGSWREVREYVTFGVKHSLSRVLGYSATHVDQLIVRGLLGPEALGVWFLARQLVGRLRDQIAVVVTKVAFPVFSRLQDDEAGLRREFIAIVELTMVLCAPALLGLMALAPRWLVPVFGSQWKPALVPLVLLGAFAIVRSPIAPAGVLALAKGRPGLSLGFGVAFLALDAALVAVGAIAGGLEGAGVVLVAGNLLFYVAVERFGIRPLIGRCALDWTLAIVRPTLVATTMAALVAAVARFGGTEIVWLAGEIALGVAAYVALSSAFQRTATRSVLSLLSLRRARTMANESQSSTEGGNR
jgi:lipopolysaccharide exporter